MTDIQQLQLIRPLDTNGDGTGTVNANGNYASAAEDFYIQPADGEILQINRMIVTVEDTSGFSAVEYGNTAAALTNGINIKVVYGTDGVTNNFTSLFPIKANSHWGSYCYDVDLKTWSTGNEFLLVRWTFGHTGQRIRLTGKDNDRFVVTLNDDLSGLVSHLFIVQGFYENQPT